MNAPPDDRHARVDHYENFPVASWLCPPGLRPPIAAIYWFARTADDIADEGTAAPEQRLADLQAYRAELAACYGHGPAPGRWPQVFGPLRRAIAAFALPEQPLADLLDAFGQDVAMTRDGAVYADRAQLLDYCSRSANPVGRLLLHLYGIDDAAALAQGDAICTALQLANFWQDLGVDVPRGRFYLPADDAHRHFVDPRAPGDSTRRAGATLLVGELCSWTRKLMVQGAPLVHRVPGRAGWELRLVVQGGLRVLDRMAQVGFDTVRTRPTVGARDLPVLLWRAARM